MAVRKKHNPPYLFYTVSGLSTGIFACFASYSHLPLEGGKDVLFYGVHFLSLWFGVMGFVYFLTLHRYLFYGIFLPLFFIAAMFSYWGYTLDVHPDPGIIKILFETKPDIVAEMISLPFVLYVVLVSGVAVLLSVLYRRRTRVPFLSPYTWIALAGVMSFFVVEHYRCCTYSRRLPYNILYSVAGYLKQPEVKPVPPEGDIYSPVDSLNIVLVWGESVRADHLPANGYPRNTFPRLSKRGNTVSFSRVFTPYTYTASSLPRILSNASVRDTVVSEVVSIYSVLNRVGYETVWIGNQSPEKSYEPFIDENKVVRLIDRLHSSLSFRKAYDGEMLPVFDSLYRPGRKQCISLHTIGSHWYYEVRYPDSFRKFLPVVRSKHIGSASPEQMINSYDNTLLYLDYFLDGLIERLSKDGTYSILLYLSDHGEILGEDGKFLHARGHKAATNPAMLVWYSKAFAERFPGRVRHLKENRNRSYTTDLLYHSVLDLLQVRGLEYDKRQSIFSGG